MFINDESTYLLFLTKTSAFLLEIEKAGAKAPIKKLGGRFILIPSISFIVILKLNSTTNSYPTQIASHG